MQFIDIGFKNYIAPGRVVAMVSPESAPIKRMIQEARDAGRVIDATLGRKVRAALMTDSDHVVLSALSPETLAARLAGQSSEATEGTDIGVRE